MTRKFQRRITPIYVCGVLLRPINGAWHGRVNNRRFVVRHEGSGNRREFYGFELPVPAKPIPLATGHNMETVVSALVELWKYSLPL